MVDITNKCNRPYIYELVDFYLVALLMCKDAYVELNDQSSELVKVELGAKIREIKSHKEKRGTRIFVIEVASEIDEINRHYYNNNILVSAKDISQNVRDLKSIIYQYKEKHRGE